MNRKTAIIIFIIILNGALFFQITNHDFIDLDDDIYIFQNPYIRDGLTLKSISWAFTTDYANFRHPLTWLSHLLDFQLFGANPAGHHVTSLILHTANAVLIFILLNMMTGAVFKSAVVSLLFSVHPLHVETVAWVSDRKDLLCLFFGVMSVISYLLYVRNPDKKRYLPIIFLFVLSLMSKPMLVTLPLLLLLLDYWPLERFSNISGRTMIFPLIKEKIPLLLLSILFGIIAYTAQSSGDAIGSLESYPLIVRVNNALLSYSIFIQKTFWPLDTAIYYPHPGKNISLIGLMCAVALLAFISFIVISLRRKAPYFLTGWVWYIVTLIPVIGIVQVGSHGMADRYTYFPLTGLFIIMVWGYHDLIKKHYRYSILLNSISCIWIVFLIVCTLFYLNVWQNSTLLFEHTLKVTNGNYFIHNNLGATYAKQGKPDPAFSHYRASLEIKPDNAKTHHNMGTLLSDTGDMEGGLRHLMEAVRLRPDYPEPYNNIGIILASQGRTKEAISHYNKALALKNDQPVAHNNLGLALSDIGEHDAAMSHLHEALRIDPGYYKAYNSVASLLIDQGKADDAIHYLEKALKKEPKYAEAHNNMGIALTKKGDYITAVFHFKEAVRLAPDNGQIHKNLGITLAGVGMADEAVLHLKRAAALGPEDWSAHLMTGNVLAMLNKHDEAANFFASSLEIKPHNADAHYNLGIALAALGRNEDAVNHLKEALRIRPDYPMAEKNIKILIEKRKE